MSAKAFVGFYAIFPTACCRHSTLRGRLLPLSKITNGRGGQAEVRIIDRDEEAGMVVRDRDQADRRPHRLTLTPSGRRALQRGETVIESVTVEVLSRLSDTERNTLHALPSERSVNRSEASS